MKFLLQTLATIIACFALQYFLPWWTMAIAALVVSYYFGNSGLVSFAAGFIGTGLLWFAMAFYIDATTQSILTEKVSRLFPLNIFVLMVIVGGLVGGFAALSGTLLRNKRTSKYY